MHEPKHIIIDGPDGVGKSTVCDLLSKSSGYPIIRMADSAKYFSDPQFLEIMARQFNETVSQFAKYPFIMDRGYPTSLVYSKIFNRKGDLSYIKDIEYKLNPHVYILSRKEPFADDPLLNRELYPKAMELYLDLAQDRNYKVIDIDKYLDTDHIARIIILNLMEGTPLL